MSVGLSLNSQAVLFSWLSALLFCGALFSICVDGLLNDFVLSLDWGFAWVCFCSASLDAFKFSFLEVYNVHPF